MSVKLSDATSFVSEHTVEYAVIDAARIAFRKHGTEAIPLFFWKSREGGRMSRDVNSNMRAQLVAVFPRRPKLYGENHNRIGWKINRELHEFAIEAAEFGIPTFAALPVAKTLLEIGSNPSMYWIRLGSANAGDQNIKRSLARELDVGENGFFKLATTESRPLPWSGLSEAMDRLRFATQNGGHWFGFSGYKPVYLLRVI